MQKKNRRTSHINESHAACPCCYSYNLINIGDVPQITAFSGNKFSTHLTECSLLKCKECSLYFKWPRISKEQLDILYKNANPQQWQYELDARKDWQIATDWLNRNSLTGSILDIGCWDGKFLDCLGRNWERYGIEINDTAADKASSRGIRIIAKDIDAMKYWPNNFSVTSAFDVLEHVENPLNFLTSMVQITKHNGFIILSSADMEILPRKITGGKNLYCANPEHISFIDQEWLLYVANKLRLGIEYLKTFSHARTFTLTRTILDSLKNILYLTFPPSLMFLRKLKYLYFSKNRPISEELNYPPPWMWFSDHIIVIFRKRVY